MHASKRASKRVLPYAIRRTDFKITNNKNDGFDALLAIFGRTFLVDARAKRIGVAPEGHIQRAQKGIHSSQQRDGCARRAFDPCLAAEYDHSIAAVINSSTYIMRYVFEYQWESARRRAATGACGYNRPCAQKICTSISAMHGFQWPINSAHTRS